jgi:ankyrin repeat protein
LAAFLGRRKRPVGWFLLFAVPVAVSSPFWSDAALVRAAQAGDVSQVRLLLRLGVDPNTRADDDGAALMAAASVGKSDVVAVLLSAGAKPNAQTSSGDTPLMWAAVNGHTAVVKQLLAAGAKPKMSQAFLAALHKIGRRDILQLLTKASAKSAN